MGISTTGIWLTQCMAPGVEQGRVGEWKRRGEKGRVGERGGEEGGEVGEERREDKERGGSDQQLVNCGSAGNSRSTYSSFRA